jgi:glutamate/tyrosine decarboxylase-like PLP-dependent enzyme
MAESVPTHLRMHHFDSAQTHLILDYVTERLSMDETPLDFPGDKSVIDSILAGLLTAEGLPTQQVLGIYDEDLSKTVLSADSPRFWAFIPNAPTKASLLFDMIVSAASLQGISWLEAAGAVAAENQVLRWIADAAGLPTTSGGVFVSGGSAANLSALIVARDAGRQRLIEKYGPDARYRRLRIAVSEQVHSSIKNTLSILDVDPLIVRPADHRFLGSDLAAVMATDSDPESVVAVVATSGTTNAGIVDDLAGISSVASQYGLWFHVDGAYGGAGLFAPSVRAQYAGIENADSFIVDPHKWLFAPFDCAALIYRDPALAKSVHTQKAGYLDALHHDDGSYEWNPTDYAYHLTRRARGLPLWFSVAVNGTDAYTAAIEHGISLTKQVADELRRRPNIEVIREPTLSVVLFRRVGWSAHDYDAWAQDLLARQVAFITSTTWEGEVVGRFAFAHPATTFDMVCEALDALDTSSDG